MTGRNERGHESWHVALGAGLRDLPRAATAAGHACSGPPHCRANRGGPRNGHSRVRKESCTLNTDLVILQVCEFLDCGDGVHRFHAPARAMSRLPGITVIDIDYQHREFPVLAENADVMVMAAFNTDLFPLFARRRRAGLVTVVEANDYYPDLQAWNPLSRRWLDRSLQDSFHHALRLADGIQASMPELARRWALETTCPVVAFPNHLESVPPLRPAAHPPSRPLTVGWGGSPGHFADWFATAPFLQRWLDRRPDVHLSVMTNEYAHGFLSLPAHRYHFRGFGSLDTYFDFLDTLDIGLAPLLPSGYNQCRSDVKFLEYASRGVAGIYRDMEPYRHVVRHGENGLLYRNEEEFLACLDALADDPGLRERIRVQAHEYVHTQRRLDDLIEERLVFYHTLLETAKPDALAPPASKRREAIAAALERGERDGNYLQFRPARPELELREAINSGASARTEQRLQNLVTRYPAYLAAVQHLGTTRNDLGKPAQALEALAQANRLDPQRARTLAEMGRAHWLSGDATRARSVLERAVSLNPHFQPAWQYLIRLCTTSGATGTRKAGGAPSPPLDTSQQAEGARIAQRAHAALPASYGIALLGIPLFPPDQQVGVFHRYLDEYAPTFLDDELPLAAPAFSDTATQLPREALTTPEGLAALTRACELFPDSPRLATLAALAFERAGLATKARHAHEHARRLETASRLFEAEFPEDDGTFHMWQFSEHILDLQHDETEKPGCPVS